jgi:hypothetical protein
MAMMNRMRENTKTILMILVFAFILTIIIDWGMGGLSSRPSRGVIAKVNGDEITYDEFYQQYENQLRLYRDQTGIDATGTQLTQLENQVFESLVQQRLVNQEIKRLKLKATDKEVLEEIYNNPPDVLRQEPAFQDSNGVSICVYISRRLKSANELDADRKLCPHDLALQQTGKFAASGRYGFE